MAVDNQQIQDPSTQGTEGLKGLEGLNRLKEKGINLDTSIFYLADDYRGTMREINQAATPRQDIGFVGVGDSMFDEGITSASQLDNLANTRGELQPWYAQIGAGLAKGVILAGTTFLDGTVGLVLGAGQALAEGRASALWDNPFSKAMQSINKWSEEALPNYYTDAERNEPWYKNIFTANFLGDKLIKNIGFTVGAFYSGGVTAAGLKATKLPQIIGAVAKSSKAPAIVTSGVGAVISAVNEGRIEALNNSTDWFNLQKTKLDDRFGVVNDDTSHLSNIELDVYNSVLDRINEDRLKMGNMDLLMNIPILTFSNLVQFGRMYANGFRTARKATNIVNKTGEYATGRTIGKGITRATLSSLSEGLEEISQSAAATVSGLAYEQDVNNFYKAKINPEAEWQTIDWMKAFSQGINETVNNSSSWEEFFIGALTGALGMPRFRSIRNSEGNLQSPITLEEGIRGKFRSYKREMDRDTEIANYMNSRVQSPEFRNYYQGLIRHNKYQNDMNQAVEDNNEFEFKNAEHAQLISDIAMFDNAGKLEDLKTLISSAYDISDENIASIIENTTSILDNGDLVGPFAEFATKNENGTISANLSNKESKESVAKKITQNKNDILNTIKQYQTIKDDIDVRTDQQLSDEQLEELTWLKSQISNWQERASQLSSEVKPIISEVHGSMSQFANMYNSIKTEEGKSHPGLTDLYNDADKNERGIRKSMSILETVIGFDDKTFAYLLSSDPKLVEGIKSVIDSPLSGVDAETVQTVNSKIDDIVKLVNATGNYNTKLKEYLENPTKLQKDIESSTETIATEEAKKKSDNLKSKLIAATNLSEFRQALNEEDNITTREETLKSLEEENNEMAKNYREVTSYNNDVQRAINSLNESPEVKTNALKLFQDQFENSSNLKEIANPNSVYIDNADALYDDKLTQEENNVRFQEAQYALLRAMNQINNENRFKDRFSKEYKELKEKGKPNPSAPEKDTTGDSGTSTIPSVNGEEFPTTTYESPVGDITSTEVSEEIKQLNEGSETPQSLDNKQKGKRPYYRPAIPELHIQGTKEGDFRPFNVVVAERRKGVNFDVLYTYLENNGAFSYVNEGNLKVGDEIGFMIDPALEEKMKSYSWYKGPIILLIDKKNNQVVGSLDGSQYSISKYEGLSELEERIKAEFAQKSNKDKRFVATPTTRVSKIMIGKIPYGTEEKSLANIPNVLGEGKTPIFGIIKNGILTTNNKLGDNLIIKPVDMSQKEGRMYLLIPNAAGLYSPAAIRVKHFNRSEFNPEDVEIQNTQVFKNIQGSIVTLANSLSEDDLKEAVKSLKTNLYTGDLHIDWFTSNKGNGIRFTKIQRDSQGKEIYEENNGERLRKEEVKTVFLTEKWEPNTVLSITGSNEIQTSPTPKSIDEVANEITNILLDFNLPIQVNLGMLNRGEYNNILINSNVLTSNILDARVLSSWFTTDYFDSKGNLHQAVNPVSMTPQFTKKVETPVGGKEGVITGTKIVVNGITYGVDLVTAAIYDNNNQRVTPNNPQLIYDLAWANAYFGNATEGSLLWDNKILLPSGQVLNRRTQKYLTKKDAQKVKNKIAGREIAVKDSKKIIAQIAENQKKVDKARTNEDFYYILEDDGQYHEYERVHSRLGSNWVESKKQIKTLKDIKVKLSKLTDNLTQYNNYLKDLSNYWKVNLDSFRDKIDTKSRDTIVNIIRDNMNGTNSQRALNAGTAVDSVIRNFFTSNDAPVKPDNMSERAFTDLVSSLTEIRSNIEVRGERFFTNNIVLFQKYPDGTRIAGEVDILSVDADGNFRIYDVKTSRYSFYDFIDRHGQPVNYFKNKSATQVMSSENYYTLQLSAYKNLFESQYNTPITTLAILLFVLNYNKNTVDSVTQEKGIIITYNPNVNVPLVGTVAISEPTPTNSAVPVFNSAIETQDPINNVLPEYSLENSKVGYFIREGKLHKSYLSPIGQVNGVEVYIAKVPIITSGFGRQGDKAHVASNSYMAVFPNGNSITLIKNDPMTLTEQQAKDTIKKILEGNPQRVSDMSNEKTLIFDPASAPKVEASKDETPANILSTPSTISGAAKTIQAEQAINEHDNEFEDDLDLGNLRKIDESTSIWDQKQELEWLKKVLPQLSENNRVRVVKGLIRVGSQGVLAWGQFNNGIITLSDIAAEGTTYHEAFHVVFNLLLDNNERQALLAEARQMYGDKSSLDLEEDMAEGFREYVISRETKGLLNKIKNFFKDLWIKVTNWNKVQPHLTAYYYMINKGKYSNMNIPYFNINRNKKEEYTYEMQEILNNASRDSQGRLLAPNGEVSNLTERQYAQVRTKSFKDWFGDWENDPKNASKVVDENGEPLVVYHGDHKTDIYSWEEKFAGSIHGYFTTSKKAAQSYGPKGRVYEEFLNIRHPYTWTKDDQNYRDKNDIYGDWSNIDRWVAENLSKLGYDGIYIPQYYNSYLAIKSPNQIKSATDNIGTFNDNSDNIYLQIPQVDFSGEYNKLNQLSKAYKTLANLGRTKNIKKVLNQNNISHEVTNLIIKAIELNPDLVKLSPLGVFNVVTQLKNNDLLKTFHENYTKKVNKELEALLLPILEKYHINIIERDIDKFGGALGAFDILNKVIYLANTDIRNATTFPEEFAHTFIELMGTPRIPNKKLPENRDYIFLMDNVINTGIYKEVYEQYKNIYKTKEGNPDIYKIKKEAIGKALAAGIINNFESKRAEENSFWNKLKEWFQAIINRFKDLEYASFEDLINKISEEIINGDTSRLDKIDSSNYQLLNYAETLANQTKQDGGKAIEFLDYFSKIGNIITGSLSYRFQGTVYRGSMDNLHDIDMLVPPNIHNININGAFMRKLLTWGNRQNAIKWISEQPYFKKILEDYPKIKLGAVYKTGDDSVTVNAIYSEDLSLSEKFLQLKGSYASRLEYFTEEERKKIYLFDFFLEGNQFNSTPVVSPEGYNLAKWDVSFIQKQFSMGRAKDIFDYQRWQRFKEFKDLIDESKDNIMYQSDIRYRKIPSIQELKKKAKNKYEEYKVKLEEEYRIAQQIVKSLNNRRYYTKEDAMNAFNNSGINPDLFYRLTSYNANNSVGYKIQLLTREAFEEYKDIMNPYINETSYIENRFFDSLDPDIQMALLDKGWTKEQFDSISQEERDIAVKCIAL